MTESMQHVSKGYVVVRNNPWSQSNTGKLVHSYPPAVGSSGGSGGTENGDVDTFSCLVARSVADACGVSSSRPRLSDGPATLLSAPLACIETVGTSGAMASLATAASDC